MQTEELTRLAKRVRRTVPNVETFSLATIYRVITEHERARMNLAEFKEFIYHLTGWDISSQIIRRQLEINHIVL